MFGYMLSYKVIKVASLRFLWCLRWLDLDELKKVFNIYMCAFDKMEVIQGYMYALIRWTMTPHLK